MKSGPVVAVVGVGLIGGSIGLALKRAGAASRVIGIGRNPDRLALAKRMGAVDDVSTDLAAALDADIIILAMPVLKIIELGRRLAARAMRPVILTDVGSTKGEIMKQMDRAVRGTRASFVGVHPMAGGERAGVESASDRLFENAAVIVTPTRHTPRAARVKVEKMWRALGGKVLSMPPEEHDTACAFVSHLPHLVAFSLVGALAAKAGRGPRSRRLYGLCAGGFRDTTRIAESDPSVWFEIFKTNKRALVQASRKFERTYRAYARTAASGRERAIRALIERAGRVRRDIPRIGRGLLKASHELVVNVPDKPGMILALASPLAKRGVNIADIEVLHVREGEEGNIRLGFRTESERRAAARILRGKRLTVVFR